MGRIQQKDKELDDVLAYAMKVDPARTDEVIEEEGIMLKEKRKTTELGDRG